MALSFQDAPRIMIAGSHLYEPVMPSLEVVRSVITHIATETPTRVEWSDNWRPPEDGDPARYLVVDTKNDNLATVNSAIERAGVVDGRLAGRDPYEVKSVIEQILNGASFDKS